MTKKALKFCYIKPQFPKNAYVLILFMFRDGSLEGIIPLACIYTDYRQATKKIPSIVQKAQEEGVEILEVAVLIPISFRELILNKKEYWSNPSVKYDPWDRGSLFLKTLENPSLFNLLVVAAYLDEKGGEILEAALPFRPGNSKTIENFMQSSDQLVDIKAKYSALYSFGKPLRCNWKTNVVSEIEDDELKLTN